MNEHCRYRWRRPAPINLIAALPLFATLYFLLGLLPGEDSGGMALLPAMVFYLSGPKVRRQWLLAVAVAFAIVAAEIAGMLVGFGVAGIWPPQSLQIGSDAHQIVGAFIMLSGASVGITAAHALGRERLTGAETTERTVADAEPWHVGLLACASMAAFFAITAAERMLAQDFPVALPGSGLLAFLVLLSSGAVLVTSLPNGGSRISALFTRFGLSLLIGVAGYATYWAVYFRFDWPQTDLVVLATMVAVYGAAPTLGWWQLKRFVRREGLLR